jgi:hypothetical protein
MKSGFRALRAFFSCSGVALATLPLVIGTASRAEDESGGQANMIRPTVTVSVTASGNGRLHYKWRSSDGQITNIDAPSTQWTLPSGPGVHFAYVLVSDQKGGYTEARVVVSTDDVGGSPEWMAAQPRALVAPAGTAPSAASDAYRSFLYMSGTAPTYTPTPGVQIYATDVNDSSLRYPAAGTVQTGPDGSFTLPNVPYGSSFDLNCSFDGGTTFVPGCNTYSDTMQLPGTAYTNYFGFDATGSGSIGGHITLADGSPCGVDNDLFGVHSAGTASVLAADSSVITKATINQYGDWAAPLDPAGATPVTVRFRCEGARLSYALGSTGSYITVPALQFPAGTGQPVISGMKAPLNGRPGLFQSEPSRVSPALPAAGSPVTLDGPNGWASLSPAHFPSDYQPNQNSFLAYKGHDTRKGACQYYKAIGAVKGCNADGSFYGAVSYNDWKRAVKIEKFAQPGGVTAAATYINKTDLNLTRQHESIRYGADSLAAVVCNHLGPADQNQSVDAFVNPGPGTVVAGGTTADDAVANTIAGKNLVACVAMDYAAYPGVNGGKKFVRFYIFGPSGQLLPSVNLDGRGEKFVPGSCVPCHGGDHYAGHYPQDGSGPADFGGHMLPYDKGNFTFSKVDGLNDALRETAIYSLNQNLLNADPFLNPPVVAGALTLAGQNLIQGWYKNGTTLDSNYLPYSWQLVAAAETAAAGNGNPNAYTDPGVDHATPFYTRVLARTCRTCHVNQIGGLNFDDQVNATSYPNPPDEDAGYEFQRSTCGRASAIYRSLQMPDSQVTFNRFWLSQGSVDSNNVSTDMPQLMMNYFINLPYEDSGHCATQNSFTTPPTFAYP